MFCVNRKSRHHIVGPYRGLTPVNCETKLTAICCIVYYYEYCSFISLNISIALGRGIRKSFAAIR